MKQRLLKKILVLLFTVILTFSVFFGFISSNVNADPLPAIDGTHNFGSYFNYNGSNSAISTDTNFTIETDKYTFMSDGTGAWIDDLNKVEEEIVTITVGKNDGGSLQSFILNSVDVGEYLADGVYTVTIKGYIGTKEVFSTEPYHNVQTGEENHFPLDMSNAQGKVIDNFKIIYTKGAGTGFAHENFTLYSFTINSASTDPPPETTAPNVTSITRLNPVNEATNAETVTYCIAFDETVSGVDINDFALTTTGTATGTIASVSTDSGATRDVTVNNISGNGTLRLDLKNNGTGIIDTAGNAISGGFTLGEIYTVDTISPSVSSIARLTPVDELTNATSVTYRVTFNEVVSGVDIADFTLINTGTAIGSISSASAVGDQIIDVTVDIISGNGTLRLDLKDNGTGIVDGVGNTISGGFTGGQFYTIDTNAPTVSSIVRQTPIDEITNAATVTYRVTFSEAVSGVDTTDFVLTGTATGTIASVSADSGTTMNVIVNDISGIGTLRLDLKDSGTGIVDGIGNAISGGFTSGESYTIDTVAPRVVSIIRQMPADELTNAASVIYRVSFSKAVSGVDTTDFVLTTTGTATGTIASVSTDSGATRDVTVNNISGNGTLRLDLKNNGTGIIDTAGNAISGGFNTGQTYSIDTEAPSVSSIIRLTPRCELTNATSVTYRVTFNEVVSGVDIADFTLINTGTAIGTIASVSASSGIAIDVTVDTISGTGKLRLDLNSSGTGIVDGLGNAISGGYTTGETYTVDTVAPTISSATEVAVNNAYIDVTFSEEVRGANDSTTLVEPSDFGVNFLTNGGTATGATITSITKTTGGDIDGSEKTVRFNLNITGIPNGVETIEIKPASETSIYDIAGNSMLSTQTCGTKNLNPVTVAVTSITVKGEGDVTTIDTKAGTLQMIAEVLPTDATDKSVTWAVTEINGSATTKAT
ncbi:beta strand repeat-containing protein, partial [Brassicibacter mesophilus]|uniref:beta strand repeat-containing protein n=1 Tax=Brassicibacter mesophilus TaxID=745119 RepID=UPI003D205DBB